MEVKPRHRFCNARCNELRERIPPKRNRCVFGTPLAAPSIDGLPLKVLVIAEQLANMMMFATPRVSRDGSERSETSMTNMAFGIAVGVFFCMGTFAVNAQNADQTAVAPPQGSTL